MTPSAAIFDTEFVENNNIFVSHPNKLQHNWKIIHIMIVTYAAIYIHSPGNLASDCFIQ